MTPPAKDGSNASADEVLAWLAREGDAQVIADHGRYGITATRPFGVTVGILRAKAKRLGRDHALAQALWRSGRYEARMLATMVGDPTRLTVAEMNAWTRAFDNWALVDTACFSLFDQSRHAWGRIPAWAKARPEFVRRAAFALLWSLALHDAEADDAAFLACLPLAERAATDERNFVKKAVDMALRAVGRRNAVLQAATLALADRLAGSEDPTARWIGRHTGRELRSKPLVSRSVRRKS